MKKAYIIHGWEGHSKEPLLNWIKEELEKNNFQVKSFDMPNTFHPKIEEWVSYLRKNIDLEELDEKTYFIGHSMGCQTIMRYLEKLHKHKKIKGCIFIAPWLELINLDLEEIEIAHPWTNSKIDFERIIDHTTNITCFFSNNDPYVHLNEANKFKEHLNAKIILLKNKGHFTKNDNVKELPEILKLIK